MVRGYGNIGCGKTWMEIGGQEVEDRWIRSDMEPMTLECTGKTRTAVAREWLDTYRNPDE